MEAAAVLALAGAAFLAATLVPVSSEVALVGALASGMDPVVAFAAASAGNALGAFSSYGLGRLFAPRVETRLAASRSGRRALAWSQRYGRWSLLLSWAPVVGDPLCLAAGLSRVSVAFFTLVGVGTRVLRYGLVVWAWARW